MLSKALTKYFQSQKGNMVDVYGLDAPKDYECANFYQVNLLKDKIDYDKIVGYNVIFYAICTMKLFFVHKKSSKKLLF